MNNACSAAALFSLCVTCFGCAHPPASVAGTDPNPGILSVDEPLIESAEVECVGPEDELEELRNLCGEDYRRATTSPVEPAWGRWTTLGHLDMVVMGNPNDLTSLQYSAFIFGQPVTEGMVYPEEASNAICSSSFRGTAEFLWRNTSIRVRWDAIVPC